MAESTITRFTASSTARRFALASQGGNPFPLEVQPHNRWLSFAICLLLALAVWAVFGQTLHHEFVNWGDDVYVYENPTIARGLNWDGIVWALTCGETGHWHPVTWISHMLDCQLYGLHPGGHHLTNVLLHAATAILLFLVLRKMTSAMWRSAFVAALFAIHPLRVESVAWVAERRDVLSGLFFMLTLWAWARYAQKKPRVEGRESSAGSASLAFDPRRWTADYYLTLALFALGLLSNFILVTLPFILLLLDCWPLYRLKLGGKEVRPINPQEWRANAWRLVLEKIPLFALSAVLSVATTLVSERVPPGDRVSFPLRFGNALASCITYLWQMICPAKLAIPYLYPASDLSLGLAGVALALLVAISFVAIARWRKRPHFAVGWLWYLGTLLPVIGFVQISNYPHADHYTYLPQIGLYILVAWGAVELCGPWHYGRAVLGSAAWAILAGLLAGAYVQTGYWKDSVSLWTHTLACMPGNYVADFNLGNALSRQGNLDEAIQHFERALQLNPGFAEAHCSLGVALATLVKLDEAIQHFERALQLNPDFAEGHYNLGFALATQGKWDEAVQHYERALQFKPDDVKAHCNLGVALAAQRKWDEAIQHYQRALQLKPDYVKAHFNLGNALASQGKLNEAIPHFQQALTLATTQGNTALTESIRTRLKSCQPALLQPQTP